MSKKVLMITQNFYPEIGSAANRMKNIYQLLKEEGYEVSVVTTEPSYPNRNLYKQKQFWDDTRINEDNHIHRVAVRTRKYSIKKLNRLFYYLEMAFRMFLFVLKDKSAYDIVFTTSPSIFVAMAGVFAKFRYKCRLILDIRDLWPESLKGVGLFDNKFIFLIFNKVEASLYRNADHIIVNSKGFIPHIKSRGGTKPNSISFIPNAARREEISAKRTKEGFKAVYAGNLGLAQDINVIKELAKKLKKYEIPLTIIGYGMKKDHFRSYIREQKLDNVKICRPLSRKECFNLMAEHSAGIVTLKNKEVFETVLPGKVVDYMTCRVPMVASVTGYSKSIIQEKNVGFVSAEGDVDDMINHILYLKKNPSLREEMEGNCAFHVHQEFTWEKNIALLKSFLEEKTDKKIRRLSFRTKDVKVDHYE